MARRVGGLAHLLTLRP